MIGNSGSTRELPLITDKQVRSFTYDPDRATSSRLLIPV